MKKNKNRKPTKIVLLVVIVAILLISTVVITIREGGNMHKTPAGNQRLTSSYITMRDRVRLAVDVWFPPNYESGKLPTLVRFWPYWRSVEPGPLAYLLHGLGIGPDLTYIHASDGDKSGDPDVSVFGKRGYAVVIVDGRGQGASSGKRPILFSPDEVADYNEVIDWISKQSWSNGDVGVYGLSSAGISSDLAAGTRNPALRAIAPLYSPFDLETEVFGIDGVRHTKFLRIWSENQRKLDANDLSLGENFWNAWKMGLFIRGVRPVDNDSERKQLTIALQGRNNTLPAEAMSKTGFRDDPYGTSSLTLTDIAPINHSKEEALSNLPIYAIAGYHDSAIITGAIRRYSMLPNRQELTLGPFSHGGHFDTDPYKSADTLPVIGVAQQYERVADFFDRYMKPNGTRLSANVIHYYVMGADVWRNSEVWPPADTTEKELFLSKGTLLKTTPSSDLSENFQVDFAGTSGSASRWLATGAPCDVTYGQDYLQTSGKLTYTSTPFDSDQELTGTPMFFTQFSTDVPDAALYAHLQDIAPDGKITYVTEGMLRLIHRKSTRTGKVLTSGMGISRSFLRIDATPLVVGKLDSAWIQLQPTSALIRAGHRLRLVLIGHDASAMERYPESGSASIRIFTGGSDASRLVLPLRPWTNR